MPTHVQARPRARTSLHQMIRTVILISPPAGGGAPAQVHRQTHTLCWDQSCDSRRLSACFFFFSSQSQSRLFCAAVITPPEVDYRAHTRPQKAVICSELVPNYQQAAGLMHMFSFLFSFQSICFSYYKYNTLFHSVQLIRCKSPLCCLVTCFHGKRQPNSFPIFLNKSIQLVICRSQ